MQIVIWYEVLHSQYNSWSLDADESITNKNSNSLATAFVVIKGQKNDSSAGCLKPLPSPLPSKIYMFVAMTMWDYFVICTPSLTTRLDKKDCIVEMPTSPSHTMSLSLGYMEHGILALTIWSSTSTVCKILPLMEKPTAGMNGRIQINKPETAQQVFPTANVQLFHLILVLLFGIFISDIWPDNAQSIQLHYFSQIMWKLGKSRLELLFSLDKKPKNTKEAFMIYTASHYCVPFREEAVEVLAAQVGQQVHYAGYMSWKIQQYEFRWS
ncbi:hypothetical protein ACA910_012342 [Epithemia clementina (nom. ined.)]